MPLDFPTSPTNGQVYSGYVYNSTVGAWQIPDIGGSIEISATAPTGPSDGDLWWDSDDGKLYIYYDDGTSQQWVDAAGPSVAVQETPPTGYEGQLWLDSSDGSMYVYYNDGDSSQWIGAVSKSGGVLQVVSTTKTDTFSASVGSGGTSTEVTGLTASITPRSTSSKVLVFFSLSLSNSANTKGANPILLRGGVALTGAIGDVAGNRVRVTAGTNNQSALIQTASGMYLDSPTTTSTITYSFSLHNGDSATQTLYVNRSGTDTDTTQFARAISTITLIEVAS